MDGSFGHGVQLRHDCQSRLHSKYHSQPIDIYRLVCSSTLEVVLSEDGIPEIEHCLQGDFADSTVVILVGLRRVEEDNRILFYFRNTMDRPSGGRLNRLDQPNHGPQNYQVCWSKPGGWVGDRAEVQGFVPSTK